ncbi:MAG TPA: 2-methylaconitate cis-trans isomerase PrpF [Rectinemataceae bacterium]|nr:2-methylaconitate cis-trans isomerase PrpF [Rectinemataceae bacterium]
MTKRIPAVYMRGGSSKGVFFLASDLPRDPSERDALLLRVMGSPDPFGTQMDGMGGATSSTSKVVIIGPSNRKDCDVDYLFGAVAIDRPVIDWSGNCGNLTSAVGPFALSTGLVPVPGTAGPGFATVRIWQANIGAKIVARVPLRDGRPLEEGDFVLDGVAFPGAEIRIDYLDPAASESGEAAGGMFPSGKPIDELAVPRIGRLEVSMVNAGNPAVFARAADLGLTGTELPGVLNADAALLTRLELVRSTAAVAMGLASSPEDATRNRPHTPKLALVSAPATYTSTAAKTVAAESIDLCARVVSMGKLHHAIPGTVAVAFAVASALPDTIVSEMARLSDEGLLRLGHPAGTMTVGAEAEETKEGWKVRKVSMGRSARVLMSGFVYAQVSD